MSDDELKRLLEGLFADISEEAGPTGAVAETAAPSGESPEALVRLRRHALYLQTASQVSRAASSILDLDQLLPQVVDLIREQFGLYYVGLFLTDEGNAVLQAGTGDAGRQMIEAGHLLPVGGDSMIGWCIAHQQARIALDVGEEAVRFENPFLPKTRSEMALPLVSRGEVLGAMTIQSAEADAFPDEDITILQTMADQLANAIENARLFRERERRVTELAMVNEIGQALASALSLNELLELVHQQVSRLFDTTNFYIVTYREGEQEWTSAFHLEGGQRQPLARHSIQSGLTGYLICNRRPVFLRTVAENLAFKERHGIEIIGQMAKSWLGVPLIAGDKLVGVMAIQNYEHEQLYGDEDLALFSTIGAQVAGALDNLRLIEEAHRRAREMEAINEVGQTITSVLDLEAVLRQIVDITKTRFGHYFVNINLVEDHQLRFQFGSTIGASHQRLETGDVTLGLLDEHSLVATAARTGQPVLVGDVLSDPRYLPLAELPDTRSELAVPIEVKGRITGVLDVQGDQPFAYDQTDIALLQSLASQAGVAIENARLFQEREQRIGELAVVNEIGRAVSVAPNLEELLKTVYERVSRLFDASSFYIATYQEGDAEWDAAFRLERGERLPSSRHSVQTGLTGYILRNRKPVLLPNTQAYTAFHQEQDIEFLSEPARSWLGVPLVAADKVVGVMAVQSYDEENLYGQEELVLLSTIAAQVASSLDNLRLLEETRRRAQNLAVITDVGQALTSVLDLDVLLKQIVDTIKERFGHYFVGILLVEGEELVFRSGSLVGGADSRWERGGLRLALDGYGLNVAAATSGQPVLANDVSLDGRYGTVPGLEPVRAELDTPILVKGRVIGTLTVQSDQVNAFDASDVTLLQTLANQAGTAIENARLFEEAKHRAEEFGVLHQVSLELAQESQDINTVLETITQRSMALLDSDGGGVWLWHEDDQELELAITYQVGVVDFTGRRLKPGEGLTGRAFAQKKIQIIDDYRAWLDKSSTFHDAPFISGLAAPLLWQAQVVGVLVLTRSQEKRPYLPGEQDLAELLAAQAAAVIQNARLFEETRQRSAEMQSLYETSLRLSTHLETAELLRLIVEQAVALLQAETAGFYLYEPKSDELVFSVAVGYFAEFAGQRLKPGEGLAGRVFEERRTLTVEDYQAWSGRATIYAQEQRLTNLLGVPLVSRDIVLGVLDIGAGASKPAFEERDIWLAELFAAQAATALENARLFEETQQRIGELIMLSNISQALASAPLEAREIAEIICRQFVEKMDVPEASISLPDPQDPMQMHVFVDLTSQTPPSPRDRASAQTYHLADFPATARVMETSQPLVVHASDPDADPAELAYMKEYDTATLAIIPLAVKGRTTGVIELESWDKERHFTQQELDLALTMANQAAVALENAHLLAETQARAEEQATLRKITETVSLSLDVQTLLDTTLDQTLQALGFDAGLISLYAEEVGRLVLAGQRGVPEPMVHTFETVGLAGTLCDYVFQTGKTMSIGDVRQGAPVNVEGVIRQGLVAYAGAPLNSKGEPIGTICFFGRTPRQAGEEELRLLEAIGDQVGLGIGNTRLFEETQKRAEELAILNDMARTLSTRLDVDATLYNIYRYVSRLMNSSNFYIALHHPEVDEISFPLVVENGQQIQWGRRRSGRGLSEYVIRTAEPLLIKEDVDGHIRSRLEGVEQIGHAAQSWLGVPLVIGDQVLGIVAVQGYETARLFTERQRDLLVAIANQAAIAIQNARLFGEVTDSERKHRVLLDSIQSPVLALSDEWSILYCNDAYARFVGRPGAELEGKSLPTLFPEIHHSRTFRAYERVQQSGQPEQVEGRLGEREIRASVYRTPQGILAISDDITVEKRAQAERERLLAETESLYRASAELNAAQSYGDVLHVLRRHTILGAADRLASLSLFDRPWVGGDRPDWILTVARWAADPTVETLRRQSLREFASALEALQPGQPTIATNLATDTRLDERTRALYLEHYQAQSTILAPLAVGGQWLGYVDGLYTQPTEFAEEEVRRLMALAGQAAVLVLGLRQLEATQARARREQVLREITTRVRASTDPDTVMRTAVRELGEALSRPAFIHLGSAEHLSQPPAPPGEGDGRGSRDVPVEGGE